MANEKLVDALWRREQGPTDDKTDFVNDLRFFQDIVLKYDMEVDTECKLA